MSWKQFGGTDNISKHILSQSNNSGKSIFEIEQNIVQIGNTRLGENQQNGIWFKGLGHSDLSLSDFSDRIANTVIEERYYNKLTGDSELFLFKAKNTNPNIVNPYTDSSFDINLKRGDRIRLLAPTIAFDTYNSSIDYDTLDTTNETYKNENTRVIINENGFVGINTIHPGQFLDIHGKINLQSSTSKINMYISNNSNPDPSNVGINNIGIGAYVFSNSEFNSSHNIALGHSSLKNITSGYSNISIGNSCLIKTNTGKHNVAMGNYSLAKITDGDYNLAIGNDSLKNISSGSNNIAIGTSSNSNLSTSSNHNISIGNLSAQNMLGNTNNLIGTNSGINLIGNFNSGFGHYTFSNCKGDYNVALGYQCLKNSQTLSNTTYNKNVFVGSFDNNGQLLVGGLNTGIGYNTQLSSSGDSNVSVGSNSLTSNSGSRNTAIGAQSNINNSGSDNVSVGINSLSNNNYLTNQGSLNTAIGSYTGIQLSGDMNTTIGCYSDIKQGCNNSTSIGCYARADISNAFILGDASDNFIKYGLGTSTPEYTIDVRKTLRDVGIHLKCGRTNHSELLLTRYSDDTVVDDVASTFFMRYNSRYDTNFVSSLGIDSNFEEKTYLGFTKDNKYIPVVTYSNLGRIGFLNTSPEYMFDVSGDSRFKSSVNIDGILFAGNANPNSSFYDNTDVTKFYFKDKTLFVDGFTVGSGDIQSTVNFSSICNVNFDTNPSMKKGITIYGGEDYDNPSPFNYSLDLFNPNGLLEGKTDARIDGHLIIGKSLGEGQRIYNLDVAGDVRFDNSANLNYLDVSNTANFNHNVTINSGVCSFNNICDFNIDNKTCSFLQESNLNISGGFTVDNFSAPYVKSSRFTSMNDHSFNNVFNIYDNPIDNTGIIDSSGFSGFSFGDIHNRYDQLVQIRSKDSGSEAPNNLDRFNDGKSKNQLLFSSENNTNNSQLLIGTYCDNVDANNKSFIMATDSLYIGKSSPNNINISDASANIIIDTNGVVNITGNNLVNSSNSVVFDVSGNSKMNNINCLQNITSNSSTVHGDISCGNFIYAKKLIVDSIIDINNIPISTDLIINDISAATMKLDDRFDISNLLSIEVSSNSIVFNDTNIDVYSTPDSAYFNVYRPMTIFNNALNISGGSININNGNMNISGSIIAENFEINSNITAIYASIDDIDVSSIDITTATIVNSDIQNLDAYNITIKQSGGLDTSAGVCTLGNTNLYGTLDISGSIISDNADISTGNIDTINSTNIYATHATITDISINNNIDVSANIKCDTISGKGTTPIGGIILYNGHSIDIPSNWTVCDGNNNTPDLSNQTIFDTSTNITYYVRENSNAATSPYYIFSDTSGGTALNSDTTPLKIITGNNYTFIASTILGTIDTNGFSVGGGMRSNNVSVVVTSTGTGLTTGTSGFTEYDALAISNEQLSFTIPRLFTTNFVFFNSQYEDRLVPFTITDSYTIVYIKRVR